MPEQICFTPAFHSFIARRHLQQFITPLLAKARHASMNFSTTYGNAGQVSNYSRNFSALPLSGFFTNNSGLSIRITNKNFTLNRVNCHVSSVRYRIIYFSVPHLLSDTIIRNRIHELDYLKCLFMYHTHDHLSPEPYRK